MTSFPEQEANNFHPPLNLILQPLLALIMNVKRSANEKRRALNCLYQ